MQLSLNRLEKKYFVQEIEIEDDSLVLMVDSFVTTLVMRRKKASMQSLKARLSLRNLSRKLCTVRCCQSSSSSRQRGSVLLFC